MSQLTNNLSAIAAIKSDIAAAIEDKGVSMEGVSFGSYADKIGEITTSFVTEPLNVTDNGTYTPGQGVDGYSQVTVNVPQSVTGFTEKDLTEKKYTIVNLNNSASYVASSAFDGYGSLKTVNLQNVSYVHTDAFANCPSLTTVELPECIQLGDYNKNWVAEKSVFYNCGRLSSLYLPKCEVVCPGCFLYDRALSQISLPKCRIIGQEAFNQTGLNTTVYLPNCELVSTRAFIYITTLPQISLPKVREIGSSAFYSCSSLSKISIPECYLIGSGAFQSCNITGRLELPNCFILSQTAFRFNKNITEISAPYVVSMEGNVFTNNYSTPQVQLSVIDFPCLYTLSGKAFFSVNGITKINLPIYGPRGTYDYGPQQNWNCSSLMELSVGNRLYYVPYYNGNFSYWISDMVSNNGSIYVDATMYDKWMSASGWSSWSSLFVSEGDPTVPMLSLSDGLLYGKTEAIFTNWYSTSYGIGVSSSVLTTVSLPECKVIDTNAFWSFRSLSSMYIPNCVYIGRSAFRDCGISVIDLPKCRYIGSYGLAIYSIKSITLGESVVCYFEDGVFNYADSNYSVFVPSSLVDDYKRIYSSYASHFFPIPE